MKDYYRILEVHPDASQEVMNGAYRSLVKQFHPDTYHTTRKAAMTEKMREINEAYQVLSNATTRATYDQAYQKLPPDFGKPAVPVSLSKKIKSVLLWTLVSYLALTVLIKPLISNPFAKLLVLLALGVVFIRFYVKQKKSR